MPGTSDKVEHGSGTLGKKPSTSPGRGRIRGRLSFPRVAGFSLLEVLIALLLSLVTLLSAAPAVALSLRILSLHQLSLDHQAAAEAAWNTLADRTAGTRSESEQSIDVGEGRTVRVVARPAGGEGALEKWRVFIPDSQYSQERWRAR